MEIQCLLDLGRSVNRHVFVVAWISDLFWSDERKFYVSRHVFAEDVWFFPRSHGFKIHVEIPSILVETCAWRFPHTSHVEALLILLQPLSSKALWECNLQGFIPSLLPKLTLSWCHLFIAMWTFWPHYTGSPEKVVLALGFIRKWPFSAPISDSFHAFSTYFHYRWRRNEVMRSLKLHTTSTASRTAQRVFWNDSILPNLNETSSWELWIRSDEFINLAICNVSSRDFFWLIFDTPKEFLLMHFTKLTTYLTRLGGVFYMFYHLYFWGNERIWHFFFSEGLA